MPEVTLDTLLANLEKSNLLTPEQLEAARRELATADEAHLPQLVASFAERGWITSWQGQMLLSGRHAFFLKKYKLLDQLGEGGMGSVFKAEDAVLGRIVAIKVIAKKLVDDENAVARFRREIQAAASLIHPNIVTAYDADSVGGRHFLVMEHVPGSDLGALVKKEGKLPIGEACEYIRQAAVGLEHAHQQGMVHRDIKPSNLLLRVESPESRVESKNSGSQPSTLNSQPTVKILDMGLARLTASDGQEQTELTHTGQIVGTPDYISPEQARNTKTADIRSDIYSLGCTLFRLLTGRVPFEGDGAIEKITARLTEDAPRLRDVLPDAPEELEAVVSRMLDRNPAARYQRPDEVALALMPFAKLAAAGKKPAIQIPAPQKPDSTEKPGFSPPHSIEPGLNDFLNQLDTAAARDEELDTGTQELERTQPYVKPPDPDNDENPWSAATILAPPAPAGDAQRTISRAGRKLQEELAARSRADRRRNLIILAVVAGFIGLIAGLVGWQKAGQTTLIVDWPLDEREGATIEVDGKRKTLSQRVKLSFRGSPGKRTLRVTRDGYEPIEESWNLGRASTETFRPEWQPTAATARKQELELLRKQVDDWAKAIPQESPLPDLDAASVVREALGRFQDKHRGTAEGTAVASLISRLPCPLDLLERSDISPEQMKIAGHGDPDNAPTSLVAIVGDGRMKHWSNITDVTFHPDGRSIATAGMYDEEVNVWSVETGDLLKTITRYESDIYGTWSVDFSRDGNWMLTTADGQAQLWDATTYRWIKSLGGQNVTSVAFHPDGTRAAAGSGGGGGEGANTQHVFIWDIESGKQLHRFPQAGSLVAFSPDGRLLASSGTGKLFVWDVETGDQKGEFPDGIQQPGFSRDGRQVAAGNWGFGVITRSTTDFSILHKLSAAPGFLAFGTDGAEVLSRDGVWNLYEGKKNWGLPFLLQNRCAGEFSPDSSLVAVCGASGRAQVFDATTGKEQVAIPGHWGLIAAMSLSADGRSVATAGSDGTVRTWSLISGENEATLTGHQATNCVEFSQDGKWVVSDEQGAELVVWSPETDDSRRVRDSGVKTLALAFSPDGRTLVSTAIDSIVRIWDAETYRVRRRLEGHGGWVRCTSISGDSRRIATGDDNGTLFLWDAATGKRLWSESTGETALTAVAFAPDDSSIAYARTDGLVGICEATTGRSTLTLDGHNGNVTSLDFSPNGRLLASSAFDGTIRLWDPRPGGDRWKQTLQLGPRGGRISHVAFTPDGRHLVTANANGTVYVLRLKEWSAE